jgi:hypothetical protein
MITEQELDAHGLALEASLGSRDTDRTRELLYGGTPSSGTLRLTATTTALCRLGIRIGSFWGYALREPMAGLLLRFDRPELLAELLQATSADDQPVRLVDLLQQQGDEVDQRHVPCLIAAILQRSRNIAMAAALRPYQRFIEIALTETPDSEALAEARADPEAAAVILGCELRLALRAPPATVSASHRLQRSKLV